MVISAAITTNYKLAVSWGFTLKPVGEAEKRKTWVHSWLTMLVQTSGLVALLVVAASGSPQNKVRFRDCGKFPHVIENLVDFYRSTMTRTKNFLSKIPSFLLSKTFHRRHIFT